MAKAKEEQSLIIMKPDCVVRGLMGEIISRFEKKGLKIIGLKMVELGDVIIEEHYGHHKDKPFFHSLKKFMQSAPVVVMAVSGFKAVGAVRIIVGPTMGFQADAGSIRGDLSMSNQNVVHASDSVEAGEMEIKRFFRENELFNYNRADYAFVYGPEDRGE
ncbi:MAG: Nucleoside diphosphate kinase [Parcubacteria group bacterium GW2011_GWF2_38_76]|nr:MAG: Nucleoside diphosphate kinase [Parcubacteria group bacterium GW2011_GWF2_38_76]HBM45721.1 nucleoside-diphosphate kinase [Patescibacteria group bacterium]